jgi:RND family efflux transporter MFP subunit
MALSRRHTLGLLLAVAAVAGCQAKESPAAAPKAGGAPTGPPRVVRVVPAAETPTARTVTATGTLSADEQVVLGAKVTGRLLEVSVDLGSPVKKGQTIGRVDPRDYQYRLDQAVAAVQQARARLGLSPAGTDDRVATEETAVVRQAKAAMEEARLNRDRSVKLWDQQLIARAQLDSAVLGLEAAEGRHQDAIEDVRTRQGMLVQRRSEVDLARQQLADTALVSPIDGAVALRQASVGEYLAAGAPVVTIVQLHPLRLRIQVSEREAALVRAGQAVRVTVDGAAGVHLGAVSRLAPSIAEPNRTLTVEATIPNAKAQLRPGAFAKAEVVVQQDDKVITVPAAALVTFAGVEKVLTVKEGKSVEVRVATGRRLGETVEILSGLKVGEPVIVPAGNLTAGQPVTVKSE